MLDLLKEGVDFILHIDKHLFEIVTEYQSWTYLILFLIVFCETGLVVTPILPGDSLLFAAGAIASRGSLDIITMMAILIIAAILGDTVNYSIGKLIGPKVFERNYRFLKREYLLRTQEFYDKHGGKTIIFARFIPIIRTFAPFVAGVGTMNYSRFITYNITGGIAWVLIFCLAGFYFGEIPAVKNNFTLVIVAIIILSVLPPVIEVIRHKMKKKKT
jgi:membrane-associated protein